MNVGELLVRKRAGAALLLLLILAAGAVWLLQPAAPACRPRADDPEGYLLKICHYIEANQLDVSPADPDSYHIKSVEERTEEGRAVVWVFLDCCYLGDIAVFDKESGEVIAFRLGAK